VKFQRKYKLDAPKGVRGRNSDNTMIKEKLGWEPNLPLKEGLAKTYAWIEQQYADRKAGGQLHVEDRYSESKHPLPDRSSAAHQYAGDR
jgi:dTDP-D-glucose 4,6-dehydratase